MSATTTPRKALLLIIAVMGLTIMNENSNSAVAGSPSEVSNTVSAIETLEEALANAYRAGDTEALDSLLAEDYLVTDGPGTTSDKAKVLQDHRTHALKIVSFRFDEKNVRLYSGVAIVQGRYTWDATYRERPIPGSFRFLRVYVQGGPRGWRIVAGQVTRIMDANP